MDRKPPYLVKLPAAEYHADQIGQGDRPSLSSSVAKTLITESPLHAWLKHPKFGKAVYESSDSMDRGTLIHSLVFGTASENIVVLHFDDYRKKAAQEARDAVLFDKKVPILAKVYLDAVEVAAEIDKAIRAEGYNPTRGLCEMTAVWEEDTSLGSILCRGMMDYVELAPGVVLDLKTCQSAHPRACARHVTEYGYDLQWAAYTSAIRKLNPDIAGREDFAWIFCEELPAGSPRRVITQVARPDGVLRELGRTRWERACDRWAQCLKTNEWPAYAVGAVNLEPMPWVIREELGT